MSKNQIQCIWNIDEVYTIEMMMRDSFIIRKPTKQQLEEKRLAHTGIIVLLLNSDLLVRSPHYNSLQIMIPARNVIEHLSVQEVFAWLNQKSKQLGAITLSEAQVHELEDFLFEFHPFYAHILRLREARVPQGDERWSDLP